MTTPEVLDVVRAYMLDFDTELPSKHALALAITELLRVIASTQDDGR